MDPSQLPLPPSEAGGTPGSSPVPGETHAESSTRKNWVYYDVTPPAESPSEPLTSSISTGEFPSSTLVAVIGVGYVGEHLVDVFSRRFNVLGFDVSEARIKALASKYADNSKVRITSSPARLSEATHFLISVPTLLLPDKTVDTSYLRSALATVAEHARPGSTVVFESSVAVGMTRQLLGPLALSHRWFAGMSPERVDPGRTEPAAHEIPKVISGLDDVVPGSLDSIKKVYSAVFNQVVPVPKPEVAEMTKLFENCQRMVCISYVNEMANACVPFGIDPYEVCRAAATKPFGYMPYTPGLGVGGHCIPVNPYYLLSTSEFPLLKAASEAMYARPAEIGQKAIDLLYADRSSSSVVLPRVLVVGMGFKRGQSHLVNSPGLELAKSLVLSEKVAVSFADPLVTQEAIPQITRLDETNWTVEYLERNFDMIIVSFKQEGLDFDLLDQLKDSVKVQMWCS
ncbi:uncharacterized protein TRIREDRAFT_67698 [Trichoderma reesei QM6a]|jgi:nucleotide sugar dehydrogenase|uniref:Predicted protein n=2 Tax=Hypocrea jecorina TaxID=51453 RepID=G0RSY6_HYPJQ|nr:uncharacterized protein TRIREDRAFT_67698 [Trichoderma reesei QM6a]EGR45689.1 predicted protein [Trichoderma reesei QM6a]ETS01898.1 nucleotide sugar dehydrogenase [Trichoderma reesei RUT C-30]